MGSKLKEFGKRLLVRYSLNECLEGGSLEARLCPTLAKCLLMLVGYRNPIEKATVLGRWTSLQGKKLNGIRGEKTYR